MPRKSWLALYAVPAWPQKLSRQGARIEVVGRWHFLVEGSTEPGWHCVDLEPIEDLSPSCTCTSFRVRGECRHMEAILSLLPELAFA